MEQPENKSQKRRIEDNTNTGHKRLAYNSVEDSVMGKLLFCEPLENSKLTTDSISQKKSVASSSFCQNPTSSHLKIKTLSSTSSPIHKWLLNFNKMAQPIQQEALAELVHLCSHSQLNLLQNSIAPLFQKDFIVELPTEIALKIFEYLNPEDLVKVASVSSYWRRLSEDEILWSRKCAEYGIRGNYTPFPFRQKNWISQGNPPNYGLRLGACLKRSKWKALYMRDRTICRNWRKGEPAATCTLEGHEKRVITCLQVNGELIVTGSDDSTIRIWSSATGELKNVCLGHEGGVWSLLLSEDCKLVISGSTDRTVRIWDVETGRLCNILKGHISTVRCMALKNNILVSGSRDCTIRVWDIENARNIQTLYGHYAAVRCVQFDGKRIISGGYDCTVIVWDFESGTHIHMLRGHTGRVYSLLFESERNLVISGSLDTTIKIWDIVEGVCLKTLIGHQSLTSGMQLQGNILVSANADWTIKVWNIDECICLHTLAGSNRHIAPVTSIQFVGESLVATSSDEGTVKLWDVKQGTYICDLVSLKSHHAGGCIWRIKATPSMLVCAAGSRNDTESTKIIILDFNAPFP